MTNKNRIILLTAAALTGAVTIWYVLADQEPTRPKPGPDKWIARLVEHVDMIDLPIAMDMFNNLVRMGIDPQHAFEVVINHD